MPSENALLIVPILITLVLIVIIFLVDRRSRRPRGFSSISSADFERMTMPAHERMARILACMHGFPESEWRQFTAMAIAQLIRQGSI